MAIDSPQIGQSANDEPDSSRFFFLEHGFDCESFFIKNLSIYLSKLLQLHQGNIFKRKNILFIIPSFFENPSSNMVGTYLGSFFLFKND